MAQVIKNGPREQNQSRNERSRIFQTEKRTAEPPRSDQKYLSVRRGRGLEAIEGVATKNEVPLPRVLQPKAIVPDEVQPPLHPWIRDFYFRRDPHGSYLAHPLRAPGPCKAATFLWLLQYVSCFLPSASAAAERAREKVAKCSNLVCYRSEGNRMGG
ncbi:hypothetical protein BHE74_00037067 [Ensete ventricosum]|nr:hypothetical protein GW17_00015828 [Ensete ventricosum]RWW56236.1 hypothetical protein BHE74_00037067 [Ensete ventricosum]RZS06979.1 hypothetical protein BHM03_00037734 [Ensete ventricosum]